MQWVCNLCGYIHDDDEPPDYCLECGAPGSNFIELADDEADSDLDDDIDDNDFDVELAAEGNIGDDEDSESDEYDEEDYS
ncbi:MAG: rubredoxin-like domain-containing protein [Candidatus Zixiibacteriota bacterium]